MKNKYKSKLLFIVTGGIVGFIFHLNWHFKYNIQLFNLSPHVITGTLYTMAGIIIGLFTWYLLNRKDVSK